LLESDTNVLKYFGTDLVPQPSVPLLDSWHPDLNLPRHLVLGEGGWELRMRVRD
jgi:hypothetical protein